MTARPKRKKQLSSGWACETHCGVYRFEHVTEKIAKQLTDDDADNVYVVVTINWTCASGDKNHVHRNHYFALSPRGAAGVALAVSDPEVCEDVVEIRHATDAETSEYFAAWEHFEDRMPAAIPRKAGRP